LSTEGATLFRKNALASQGGRNHISGTRRKKKGSSLGKHRQCCEKKNAISIKNASGKRGFCCQREKVDLTVLGEPSKFDQSKKKRFLVVGPWARRQ